MGENHTGITIWFRIKCQLTYCELVSVPVDFVFAHQKGKNRHEWKRTIMDFSLDSNSDDEAKWLLFI